MSNQSQQNGPGWFPDPYRRYDHRYFNGTAWTADVSIGGERRIDPLGTAPTGPAPSFHQANQPNNTGGTGAIILGALAIMISWVPFFFLIGVTMAIIGLSLAISGRKKAGTNVHGRKKSTIGLVLNIFALGIAVIGTFLSVVTYRIFEKYAEPGLHDVEVLSCEIEDGTASIEGTLTNLTDETRSYTLFIEIESPDRDWQDKLITLDDVSAQDEVEWKFVDRLGSITTADSCYAAVRVFGPFPFGIELPSPE